MISTRVPGHFKNMGDNTVQTQQIMHSSHGFDNGSTGAVPLPLGLGVRGWDVSVVEFQPCSAVPVFRAVGPETPRKVGACKSRE
jgi:hypothetical protein